MNGPNGIYFANAAERDIAARLVDRRQRFEKYVKSSGLYELWRKGYKFYHSQSGDGSTSFEVGLRGPKGKFAVLRIDHFRSIVRRWVSLAHSQRSTMQPIAKFTGYDSELQVKVCSKMIDHWMQHAKLEAALEETVELASFLGAAYEEQCWDPLGGDVALPASTEGLIKEAQPTPGTPPPAGPPTQGAPGSPAALKTGTLKVNTYTPLDLILDPRKRNADLDWCITRRQVNKHDLIARHASGNPALGDLIGGTGLDKTELSFDLNVIGDRESMDSDDVTLYTFWHERTDAVPDGKRVEFLSANVLLSNDTLGKYRRIPVKRLAPADIKNTPFGFTEAWLMIAPQEASDVLASIQLSNARTFGAGMVIAPKSSGLTPSDIGQGLKMLEYTPINGMKPEKFELPSTPREVPEMRKNLTSEAGTIMGVNDVNRGVAQASLESGSALALVATQGVESATPFQKRIARYQEDALYDTVTINQDFLTAEMQLPIIGENLARLQKFSGKSIDQIIRVEVKAVNPMSRTMAGRLEMAKLLAERYPDKVSPAQFFRVAESGEWKEITEAPAAEESNISRENEMLSRGIGPPPFKIDPMTGQPVLDIDGKPVREGLPGVEYVRALITDDPIKHVMQHRMVLDSPAARDNPQVVQATLDHIEEHEDKYADLTLKRPGLLQILGLEPLMAALPQPEVVDGEVVGEETGESAPDGANGPPPKKSPGPEAPPGRGGAAKMPMFPKNPSTGERYQPPAPIT